MTDDLVKRLMETDAYENPTHAEVDMAEAKDRIEALTAQLESTLRDRKLIIQERDRTFALMLARAEKAEADNARLREALTGIKRAAAHRMQDDPKDLHSYYFHTAAAALNTGKEVMPDAVQSPPAGYDIGPGDQAVAGAAQKGAEP